MHQLVEGKTACNVAWQHPTDTFECWCCCGMGTPSEEQLSDESRIFVIVLIMVTQPSLGSSHSCTPCNGWTTASPIIG
jgi:hypothetical protein